MNTRVRFTSGSATLGSILIVTVLSTLFSAVPSLGEVASSERLHDLWKAEHEAHLRLGEGIKHMLATTKAEDMHNACPKVCIQRPTSLVAALPNV
jgi:hypothetical protein